MQQACVERVIAEGECPSDGTVSGCWKRFSGDQWYAR